MNKLQILIALSETIRSLSRIVNKNPEVVNEIDIKRLENAKQVLASNTTINANEIPKPQIEKSTNKITVRSLVLKNAHHQGYGNYSLNEEGLIKDIESYSVKKTTEIISLVIYERNKVIKAQIDKQICECGNRGFAELIELKKFIDQKL